MKGAFSLNKLVVGTVRPPESRLTKGVALQFIGVSETGSAIDVRIDDAGLILNFRIGFLFDFLPW